jgi:hypothetical protein
MKTIKTFMLLVIMAVFTSCSNDDEPKNHAPVSEDMEISMNENPTSDLITTVLATDLDGDILTYSIVSQTPTGSIVINESTGGIFIGDINAFNYEQNTVITAFIMVTDGIDETIIKLTINIVDVSEG